MLQIGDAVWYTRQCRFNGKDPKPFTVMTVIPYESGDASYIIKRGSVVLLAHGDEVLKATGR